MEFETKVLDARFEALAAHCRALFIASGRKRGAKENGAQMAARMMPQLTNDAIARRAGVPVSVLFPA